MSGRELGGSPTDSWPLSGLFANSTAHSPLPGRYSCRAVLLAGSSNTNSAGSAPTPSARAFAGAKHRVRRIGLTRGWTEVAWGRGPADARGWGGAPCGSEGPAPPRRALPGRARCLPRGFGALRSACADPAGQAPGLPAPQTR